MKKLMFIAAAAICATVSATEIASDIVGYISNDGNASEGQIICASFLATGEAEKGFWVSDIKVGGYEGDEVFLEQAYYASLFLLDEAGRNTMTKDKYFYYSDDPDGEGGFVGGKWYDYTEVTEIVAHGANDLKLSPSQAVWVLLPDGDGSHTPKFTTAGTASTSDIQGNLNVGAATAVANGQPGAVWISDITFGGYEGDEVFLEQAWTAMVYIRDGAGRNQSTKDNYFFYSDDPDGVGGFVGGVWYDYSEVTAIVPHGTGDFQIASGKGLWIMTMDGDGEHQFTVTIPALSAFKAE